MADGCVVIVGGTSGLGLGIARAYARRGTDVVITGRSDDRCAEVAAAIDGTGTVQWRSLDLAEPHSIGERLEGVPRVAHLVLAAIERDQNTVTDYDVDRALRLVTLKLVGYTEAIHALRSRLADDASI